MHTGRRGAVRATYATEATSFPGAMAFLELPRRSGLAGRLSLFPFPDELLTEILANSHLYVPERASAAARLARRGFTLGYGTTWPSIPRSVRASSAVELSTGKGQLTARLEAARC